MIYCIDNETAEVYQPLDWTLYSSDRRRIPLRSEEELREYLQRHPDKDFFLVPGPFMNREIQGASAASFDLCGEHVRCGIVRYDSAKGKIVTRSGLQVDHSDAAKQGGVESALLEQATKRLEEVLGLSASWVMGTWNRQENGRGRVVYTLRLADWMGEVSATFTPEELRSSSQDYYRWRDLWGDLLQIRSHKQLRAVTTAAGEAEG